MSRIAVRWMGAFHRYGSFAEALRWEFENSREVAAEWFHGLVDATHSRVPSRVGLLVAKGAIIRAYNGDVWSYTPDGSQRLMVSRPSAHSSNDHTECFCRPEYRGIVIRRPLDSLRPEIRRPIIAVARQRQLPVFWVHENGVQRRVLDGRRG